ncbi:hypothetical protein M011DRAFT_293158 [Sporormia fimetaria CBS 119925]|uniref:tRNA/rRNA methyltransferase SpoU type domain-containing protein n=1 Tax=Sporormia fimetaria CBS 119925 TaxID=1340428 RepID=A0A6A6UWR5_9PLEO|nr:hypothetical protein M011DRAFT_293158 [Sporormia fimetaria CBS 119925]
MATREEHPNLMDSLLSRDMESNLILNLFDDASKAACYERFWKKLNSRQDSVDLDTLRLCVKLLPPGEQAIIDLSDYVWKTIPKETHRPHVLCTLADLSSTDARLGSYVFQRIQQTLRGAQSLWCSDAQPEDQSLGDPNQDVLASLAFLKCSYWRPANKAHFVEQALVEQLCSFIGLDEFDEAAHDALSALLSLLQSTTRRLSSVDTSHSGLDRTDVADQLWSRYRRLPEEYFSKSKAFRTWFQWVYAGSKSTAGCDVVQDPLYWERIRFGLLTGFAEQRKYCLGILRQSLRLATRDVLVPLMTLEVERRAEYDRQYGRYSSLFEMIVLDRYPNQIEACLPDLTLLIGKGSLITSEWIITLLTAVLDSKVQEGVRKLVGTWFTEFVTGKLHTFQEPQGRQDFFDQYAQFLVSGYLPWVTQGVLFTSSLVCTRAQTVCGHGELLSEVIALFIKGSSPTTRRALLPSILRFVLDRGGRIFQYSIMYLLKGLLAGFKSQRNCTDLDASDFALLPRISRLPGLPEIAGDLNTVYCAEFCNTIYPVTEGASGTEMAGIPGYDVLDARFRELKNVTGQGPSAKPGTGQKISSLDRFLRDLEDSKHGIIKDDYFAFACTQLINFLNRNSGTVLYKELYDSLEALWEEADRQEYKRPAVVEVPPLFFHPKCIRLCTAASPGSDCELMRGLLTKVMNSLRRLSEGRPYLLSTFMGSLRKATFAQPSVITVLPFEELLYRFAQKPPVPKKEFLFEVAAGNELEQYIEHRNYSFYYGKREWHGYAAVVDILNRFPDQQLDTAQRLFDRLLEPWETQVKPVPIISKWKGTFQLQAMLLLSESCISEGTAPRYLSAFMHALILEQWPRWRFLLEWIIARIYFRFPHLAERILPDLADLDDSAPIQIASFMKLAILIVPHLGSEDFAVQFMTQLIPFSASPKVHIRHEAHWAIPIMWDLAQQNEWFKIIDNPAFRALNDSIRKLDRFKRPASTIRTLKLNIVEDFTLVQIFEGDYLTIETPERQFVTYDDFLNLWQSDGDVNLDAFPARVPLGVRKPHTHAVVEAQTSEDTNTPTQSDVPTAPLQTKSGFDLSSLLPPSGPPSATHERPASVILVASLIDNPTNLGGLSRISESFGLEALCINSLAHVGSKDFQSTAVTSHKHLPIHELKIPDVPAYLLEMKQAGWEVVAVEQTDRSGMLGEKKSDVSSNGDSGLLPERCVLVLGSEKAGVSAEVLAVVDRCVEIKTVGVTRSLNVQTAGGIAVYEWWREWGTKVEEELR